MTTVCMYCGRVMEIMPELCSGVSHGICTACLLNHNPECFIYLVFNEHDALDPDCRCVLCNAERAVDLSDGGAYNGRR